MGYGIGVDWELVFVCDCLDIGWCLKRFMSLQDGVERVRTHTCTGIGVDWAFMFVCGCLEIVWGSFLKRFMSLQDGMERVSTLTCIRNGVD